METQHGRTDSDRPLQMQQQWRLDLSWLQAGGEPLSQQSLKQSLEAGACGQVAAEGDGHMMFPVRTVLAIKVPNAARVSCGAVGGACACCAVGAREVGSASEGRQESEPFGRGARIQGRRC